MIVEGQVHGGIAQGIGQALLEGTRYDAETGQLVTASFMDYTMPRADDLPSFGVGMTDDAVPGNPLGIKGCGEAGAIGSPPAVINAITDAIGSNELDHARDAAEGLGCGLAPRGHHEADEGGRTMYATPITARPPSRKRPASLGKKEERQVSVRRPYAAADDEAAACRAEQPCRSRHVPELKGISVNGRQRAHRRATTHFEIKSSAAMQEAIPALPILASVSAIRMCAHRGTIGGSVANNDPAADYPAALLALGATVHTNKRQDRGSTSSSPACSRRRSKRARS
jgi:hypothetical protein